jgi:phytoene dehydrogenase-like protein
MVLESDATMIELELDRYGLKRASIELGHVYLHPDGASIAFWFDRTVEEIRRIAPTDARAYLDFSRVLTKFANILLTLGQMNVVRPDLRSLFRVTKEVFRARGALNEIDSLPFLLASEIIGERFKHQVVRDAMHACAGSTVANSTMLLNTVSTSASASTMRNNPAAS